MGALERGFRVYIAIQLLLLLLTVSQVCARGAHFGYKVNQLIKFELLTQSIMAAEPPVGSGPGCPYGLDSLSEWSRVIALKEL